MEHNPKLPRPSRPAYVAGSREGRSRFRGTVAASLAQALQGISARVNRGARREPLRNVITFALPGSLNYATAEGCQSFGMARSAPVSPLAHNAPAPARALARVSARRYGAGS